jgi:hypothetical protein
MQYGTVRKNENLLQTGYQTSKFSLQSGPAFACLLSRLYIAGHLAIVKAHPICFTLYRINLFRHDPLPLIVHGGGKDSLSFLLLTVLDYSLLRLEPSLQSGQSA